MVVFVPRIEAVDSGERDRLGFFLGPMEKDGESSRERRGDVESKNKWLNDVMVGAAESGGASSRGLGRSLYISTSMASTSSAIGDTRGCIAAD